MVDARAELSASMRAAVTAVLTVSSLAAPLGGNSAAQMAPRKVEWWAVQMESS